MGSSRFVGDFTVDLPRPGVMCTIVQVTGSHPQELGARMWVTVDEFVGTLGGGAFEHQVLAHARELLANREDHPELKDFILCRQTGQCCGGRAQVFFEVALQRRSVHLLGAGHVGRAVAEVLADGPVDVHLVDERPEWANPEGLPGSIAVHPVSPAEYVRCRRWSHDDAVCIFTHRHDLDYELATFLLREPVGYLGLIGSQHKARVFESRLAKEDRALVARWDEFMHCPIGTPTGKKNPKVIAISIAWELLQEWGLPRSSRLQRVARARG